MLGDDVEEIFNVTIQKNKTVSSLREAIKEKNPISLRDVEAKRLRLWAVSMPNVVALAKGYRPHKVPLSPMALLSEIFQMPVQRNHLHVIVDVPNGFKKETGTSQPKEADGVEPQGKKKISLGKTED